MTSNTHTHARTHMELGNLESSVIVNRKQLESSVHIYVLAHISRISFTHQQTLFEFDFQ